jgi:hypothetical protein
MHRNLRAILVLTLHCLVVAACDPGMTIGERPNGTSQAPLPAGCGLELHANDTHQSIGESWYDPEVTVRNLGESPLAIDRIELKSQGLTYRLEQWAEKDLDGTIPAHGTKTLRIGFDLNKRAVSDAFRESAVIYLRYTSAKVAKECTLEVIGTR